MKENPRIVFSAAMDFVAPRLMEEVDLDFRTPLLQRYSCSFCCTAGRRVCPLFRCLTPPHQSYLRSVPPPTHKCAVRGTFTEREVQNASSPRVTEEAGGERNVGKKTGERVGGKHQKRIKG
ncbi:hypothetical protein E2C01_057815 [Portunus trituberculatus]|uniref:Uncharacterized protein n=1 Tax=Portunus trituberculatus TaxID=210409 RepID=A0A5B7H111_PORTR|nr:hypothetical protein [Portunus trituberculatus]